MQWDTSSTNSYRMGKEGKYDLKPAEPAPASQAVAEDSDTEDDTGNLLTRNHHTLQSIVGDLTVTTTSSSFLIFGGDDFPMIIDSDI